MSDRAHTRSVVLGVAWRTLHRLYTTPALLLPSLVFPLFFFLAFAGGLSSISKVPNFHYPPGYTAFQFAFVLLQSSAFGGVFTGFGIAADFEGGFARRLLLAAPHHKAVLAGYALAALSRTLLTGAIVFGVGLAAGMNVDGNGVDLFGLIGLALLVNFAAGMWAAGIALRLRSIQAGPFMQIPVFLALFLAPVYVPQSLLLPHCSAVICHGGPGTILNSLTQGLPLLILPQGADQYVMGERILAAGVGLRLVPADVNPSSVRANVLALLEESYYRAGAHRLKREIAAMPGPEEVVHLIEEVAAATVGR